MVSDGECVSARSRSSGFGGALSNDTYIRIYLHGKFGKHVGENRYSKAFLLDHYLFLIKKPGVSGQEYEDSALLHCSL